MVEMGILHPLFEKEHISLMASSLMVAGLELMLIGMGMVFTFLALLVVATQTMSSLSLRWVGGGPRPEIAEEEVAAITAAIAMHRARSG